MTVATELATIDERLRNFIIQAERAQHEASVDRAEMMRAITALTHTQRQLSDDMAEVKPVTEMVSSLRAKIVGAGIVLGVIGTLAWTGILFFKTQIINILSGS